MNKPFTPNRTARPARPDDPVMLTAEEETALARAWRDKRDVVARNRLVSAFEPLVHKMVWRFTKTRSDANPDLLQQAFIGLMRAADGFDPDRGVRFSTYAAWWVRAELQDYRMLNWSLVRRGRSAKARRAFFQLGKVEQALPEIPGETVRARDERIAEELGCTLRELDEMRAQFTRGDSSLHRPVDESGTEALELLPDTGCDVEADVAARHDRDVLRATMIRHFGALPDRERTIVVANVMQDPPMTLNELGEVYGISRERVRQLRDRGLERLRDTLRKSDPGMFNAL